MSELPSAGQNISNFRLNFDVSAGLASSLLLAGSAVFAATPLAVPVNRLPPTATYKCTGVYRSYSCTTTLYLNGCKNSIKVVWAPLKMPGTLEWAKTHRTWCSVVWQAEGSVEERKFRPEKCEDLLRIFAAGLQGFPEVKWQDANCNLTSSPDAILYESQQWEKPEGEDELDRKAGRPSLPELPELEPKAISLEEARACILKNDKSRVLLCPVLPQRVQAWLHKFLAAVEVSLEIRNKLK